MQSAELKKILELPNVDIEARYKESLNEAIADGQRDIKFAVSGGASPTDVKRAQLAIEQAHKDGKTSPLSGI